MLWEGGDGMVMVGGVHHCMLSLLTWHLLSPITGHHWSSHYNNNREFCNWNKWWYFLVKVPKSSHFSEINKWGSRKFCWFHQICQIIQNQIWASTRWQLDYSDFIDTPQLCLIISGEGKSLVKYRRERPGWATKDVENQFSSPAQD